MSQELVSGDAWLHPQTLDVVYVELLGFSMLKVKSSSRLILVYRFLFPFCSF